MERLTRLRNDRGISKVEYFNNILTCGVSRNTPIIRVLDNIGTYNMTIKQLIGFILFILLMLSIGFIEKPQDYHLPLEAGQNYSYL